MLSEHHVLVIDDQPLIRKVLKGMLEVKGCPKVSEAANGDEAHAIMHSQQPTLVLCDINMSPGDGFSFLSYVRNGAFGRTDTPVIFLTCNVETSVIERAVKMGVSGYLLKPVTAIDLAAQIGKVLDKYAEA